MADQITYRAFCEQHNKTIDAVRMRVRRNLGKQSVNENDVIPPNVLSMLTGGAVVSSVAPVQKEVAVRQTKAAKQATIPARYSVQYTEPEKRGIESPVKSQMSSVFSFLRSLSSADKVMIAICIITAYGLISQYRFIGFGAAVVYSIFAMNTSRLTKKELSLQSAKMSVGWFVFFDIMLSYVHATMYYQEIVSNDGLMINSKGDIGYITAWCFGIGVSLMAIVVLYVSIKETWEKTEYEHLNAPIQKI